MIIIKQQKEEYYKSNLKMIFVLNIEIVIYMLYIISIDFNCLKTCQEITLELEIYKLYNTSKIKRRMRFKLNI